MGSKMRSRVKPARSMRQRRGKYLNDTASDTRYWTEKVQKSYRLRPPTDKKKARSQDRAFCMHRFTGDATRIAAKE
jgi:5-methylcytosine-specific restriction endonuclease McrA